MSNTSLFAALNVESLETKLLKDKLNLFVRLCENPFTKEIMCEANECFPLQSFLNDVASGITSKIGPNATRSLETLIELAKHEIVLLDSKEKSKAKLDTKVNQLHEAFKIRNKEKYLQTIWPIIGYHDKKVNRKKLNAMQTV